MRTINEAYNEIKAQDNNTAITPHSIRKLIKSGVIPSVRSGAKYLINLDTLESCLSAPISTANTYGVLRAVR